MVAYRYRCTFTGTEPARLLDVLADDSDHGARFAGAVTDAARVELVGMIDPDALEAGPTRELLAHEWDGFGTHDPNTCETCEMFAAVELELLAPLRAWLDSPAGRFAEYLAGQGATS